MNKVILFCLLLLLTSCATHQRSQFQFSGNVTLTCIYNTLEEMDGITKTWIYYDGLPPFPILSRSHLLRKDGVGFEGKDFFGNIIIEPKPSSGHVFGHAIVYSEGHYWGFEERRLNIQKIKEKMKAAIFDRCIE